MAQKFNNEIFDAIIVNRQEISQVVSRLAALEVLVQGLVDAGQVVSSNVTEIKASLGVSDDGTPLHGVVEAVQDVIVSVNDEVMLISGKVGV